MWGLGRGASCAFLFGIAHSGALQEREFDFGGGEFFRKQHTGNLACVDRGAFQIGLAEIDAAKIGLPEVAIAEIQSGGIQAAQIKSS